MALGIGNAGRRSGGAIPTVETILVNGSPRTSANVGDVLTVLYPPKGLTAPTQQALRNGTSITGATGFSYTTVNADQALPITFSGTGLDGLAYTTAAVTVAALAVDAPTTNIPGGSVTLDETAQTATLSGTAADDGVYSYDPAAVAAGLPQFLRVNTLSVVGNDYDVNDDGIYLSPANDLPDLVPRVEVNGSTVQTTLPYTTNAEHNGLQVDIVLKLENDATAAAGTLVEAHVEVQAAAVFTGTELKSNGGYLTRAISGQAQPKRFVLMSTFKRTADITGNNYVVSLNTNTTASNGTCIRLDNSFKVSAEMMREKEVAPATEGIKGSVVGSTIVGVGDIATAIMVAEVGQTLKLFISINGGAFGLHTTGAADNNFLADEVVRLNTDRLSIGHRPSQVGGALWLGNTYRNAIFLPTTIPDFADPLVGAKIRDGAGLPAAQSLVEGVLGPALTLFQGPANTQTADKGSLGGTFTLIGNAYTDVAA